MNLGIRSAFAMLGVVVGVLLGIAFLLNWERPPVVGVQHGFRGTGMDEIYNPRTVAALIPNNQLPDPIDKVDPSGQPSSQAYQNVQVLKTVDSSEFLRLMAGITAWVSPAQSCNYCHNPENLAEDGLYTKVVARKMFQMVQYINANWQSHVGPAGVTCYTCHRGNPVPTNIWYENPGPAHAHGMAEASTGKNLASSVAGLSSLPYDPLTPFLEHSEPIRVQATQALPGTDLSSIKQTDWTYALMFHLSTALGVNCTYCHNTRSFGSWQESTPQRVTAWYGIRMVRDLNAKYLESLKSVFPRVRLGVEGDVPKINCATCHQGVFKPLYGASMIADYPELTVATDGSGPAPAVPK